MINELEIDPRNEETDNRTDVEHVDQYTELVGVAVLGEVITPKGNLLGGVDKHSVQWISSEDLVNGNSFLTHRNQS